MKRNFRLIVLSAACMGLILIPKTGEAVDVTALVKEITAANAENGAGPKAARAAKKKIVDGGAAVLPDLLLALENEDSVTVNWVLSAFQDITRNAIRLGGKNLPADKITAISADEERTPRVRRLAIELLAKAAPRAATERLFASLKETEDQAFRGVLLGMIARLKDERVMPTLLEYIKGDNSPAAYDAVTALLALGDYAVEKGDKVEAWKAYQHSFELAKSPGHISSAATKLRSIGYKAKVADRFEFLTSWYILGPFDDPDKGGLTRVYPPEEKLDLRASYDGKDEKRITWRSVSSRNEFGNLDFTRLIQSEIEKAVAYAFTAFESPVAGEAQFLGGSDDTMTVWLNGKKIMNVDKWEGGVTMDQHKAKGTLKKGRNEILVKIVQGPNDPRWGNGWGFQIRIADLEGKPFGLGESMTLPFVAAMDDPKLVEKLAEVAKSSNARDARDAINAIMRLANRAVNDANKDEARRLYRVAFDNATNQSQIRKAAEELHPLGIDVNIADKLAFVLDWLVLGPFDNPEKSGFTTAYAPEKELTLRGTFKGKDDADIKWRRARTFDDFGVIDLREDVAPIDNAAAYAYTTITSTEDMEVQIRGGSDDTMTVWLNGEKVMSVEKWIGASTMDQHRATAELKKGKNTILVKICQGPADPRWTNGWAFQLRICDSEGRPMALKAKPR